jgi:hypothetical protein
VTALLGVLLAGCALAGDPAPSPPSAPHGVIVGPDGAAWVTDGGLNAILRVDPEMEQVQDIPTWPWSTATVSGFVSALVLPIALFLIQMVLRDPLGA